MCSLQIFAQDDLNVDGGEDDEPLFLQPVMVDIGESYLGLSFGYILPTGSFGRKEVALESGYSNPGLKLSLDGAFIFGRNIGMGWSFGSTLSEIDLNAYKSKIEFHLPNQAKLEGELASSGWQSNYLAIGPYISLPETRLMFDVGIMGGLVYAVSPEVSIVDGMMDENPLIGAIEKDATIAPMLLINLGINKHIGRNIRIFFKGEIMFSRPEFREELEFETKNTNFYYRSVDSYFQSIGFIGLNGGLAFEIGDERKKEKKRKRYKQRFGRINKKIKKQTRKNNR